MSVGKVTISDEIGEHGETNEKSKNYDNDANAELKNDGNEKKR